MTDEYETKSAIIGKKGSSGEDGGYPIFVNLFDVNDPHKNPDEVPNQFLEYSGIHKIILKGLEVEYLLIGKDIVINNLKKIRLTIEDHAHLVVEGDQE